MMVLRNLDMLAGLVNYDKQCNEALHVEIKLIA